MFKYISGDIPAKPISITLTVMLGNAMLSWGFGKDNQIDLAQNIINLKIESKDGGAVTFNCMLDNNRSFTAQCDSKTYEKLEKVLQGKVATQSNPSSIANIPPSPKLSELYAAEKRILEETESYIKLSRDAKNNYNAAWEKSTSGRKSEAGKNEKDTIKRLSVFADRKVRDLNGLDYQKVYKHTEYIE